MNTVPAAKRRAVRALNDLRGSAADALVIAIEAAVDGDALRRLIHDAELLIASAHGTAATQSFIQSIRRRRVSTGRHGYHWRRALPPAATPATNHAKRGLR